MSFPEDINAHLMSMKKMEKLVADAIRCLANFSTYRTRSNWYDEFCSGCALSGRIPNQNRNICAVVTGQAKGFRDAALNDVLKRFSIEMIDYYDEAKKQIEEIKRR